MKHPEIGSLCGHCTVHTNTDDYVRNTEYECVAAYVEFPCRNKGCHKRILFGKADEHESACLFRQYECPFSVLIDSYCQWTGSWRELGAHFGENHANSLMLTNTFKPELRKNQEQINLLTMENKFFVVHTKCVVLSCKFWCLVRYIGQPQSKSVMYKYKLQMIGDKVSKPYFTGEKIVQTDICMIMDEYIALEVNISTMLKSLNCPHNVQCVIHINSM